MAEKKDDEKSEKSSVSENLILDIYKTVKVISESLAKLEKRFALHQQESENRWEAIAKLDEEQNAILAEHRSTGLAQQEENRISFARLRAEIFGEGITDPDKRKKTLMGRVESLELPRNLWKWAAGGLAGLLAILKIIDELAKYL